MLVLTFGLNRTPLLVIHHDQDRRHVMLPLLKIKTGIKPWDSFTFLVKNTVGDFILKKVKFEYFVVNCGHYNVRVYYGHFKGDKLETLDTSKFIQVQYYNNSYPQLSELLYDKFDEFYVTHPQLKPNIINIISEYHDNLNKSL